MNRKANLGYFILSFIFTALFFLSGCQDEDDNKLAVTTKVHGHLMVLGTEEVINDRPYKMVLKRFMSNDVFDETYTDENGYYEFTHDSYRIKSYDGSDDVYEIVLGEDLPDETFTGAMPLFVDTLADYSHPNQSDIGYRGRGVFSAGYQSWANVALEKKAWLELEVENIDPQIGDRIRIHYVHHRGGSKWEFVFHHGQHWKIILPGVGNVENHIDYWLHKDGVSIPRQRVSVKLGEMDTTYFKFEY